MASENSFQPGAVVPAAFGTVGLAFVIMAEELLGYQTIDLGSWGEVYAYLVFCLVQGVLAGALAVAAPYLKDEEGVVKPFSAALLVCIAAGFVLSLVYLWASQAIGLLIFALIAMSSGSFCGKIIYLLLLSEISSYWSKRILLGAFLLQSLFSPFAYWDLEFSLIVSALCALIGIVCFAACWNKRATMVAPHESIRLTPGDSSPVPIVTGLCVVMAALGFMNPLSYYPNISNNLFTVLTIFTHLLAVVLFAVCIFQFDDAAYSIPVRVALTTVCAAILIYLAYPSTSMFSSFVCAFVITFLEMITLFAVTDFASYSSSPRLQVLGVYCCAMRFSIAFGLLLDGAALSMPLEDSAHQAIGLVLGIAVVLVALWVLTPEALNKFFWGATVQTTIAATPTELAEDFGDDPHKAAQAPAEGPSKIERCTELISEHYGLTPREQEVLELFAVGRSATFIAEELTLSSNTVRKHIAHIYAKCEVHSKQELLTLIQDCPASLDDFQEKGEGESV